MWRHFLAEGVVLEAAGDGSTSAPASLCCCTPLPLLPRSWRMLCRPIVVVGWILCHRVLVRADALPLWLFVWRMLCRRAPSGECFAAVVVLIVGWFLSRHLWRRCTSFAGPVVRLALVWAAGLEVFCCWVSVVVAGCFGCIFSVFSLFLVLRDLVLVKHCLAASRIVCKLFSS